MIQDISFVYGGSENGYRVIGSGRTWHVYLNGEQVIGVYDRQDDAMQYIDKKLNPWGDSKAGMSGGSGK